MSAETAREEATLATAVPSGDSKDAIKEQRDFWKSLFQSLTEAFPEPLIVVDDDGEITHWNEVGEDFSGIAAEEAIGEPAGEVTGVEETVAEQSVRTAEAISLDEIRSGEGASGKEWHTRDIAVPLRDHNEEIVGGFGLALRVTDLVKMRRDIEEKQQRISGEITEKIEELTRNRHTVRRDDG